MPFAYVTLTPSLEATSPSSRVHALLLPTRNDEWPELAVRHSELQGFGVYPGTQSSPSNNGKCVCWTDLATPVLLPYLGAETVTKDAHSQRLLLMVLKGRFEQLTVRELSAANGDALYAADGLFAVPAAGAPSSSKVLPPSTQLLQVSDGSSSVAGAASCCYLIADDVKKALHLHGPRHHLFDLLCAHSRHEHSDRHLATHVATLQRKEEGYILVNAHPAFLDGIGVTGMINEPAKSAHANLKMVQGYAKLLPPDDPLLRRLGLTQPKDALAAWNRAILPPEGGKAPAGLSEKMVMYASTRRAYDPSHELTVDYGRSYARDYCSGTHKAQVSSAHPLSLPTKGDEFSPLQLSRAKWPQLPGWFNPAMQPERRPAFALKTGGVPTVVSDDPALVRARKAASEAATGAKTTTSATPIGGAASAARAASPASASSSSSSSRTASPSLHSLDMGAFDAPVKDDKGSPAAGRTSSLRSSLRAPATPPAAKASAAQASAAQANAAKVARRLAEAGASSPKTVHGGEGKKRPRADGHDAGRLSGVFAMKRLRPR